ncbi:hypothetical protein [Thermococcus indicus]|uniref:hypothetical protein n=1 Tax=Thermococcus indicus TaxID=2586643 RepID=UPI001F0F3E41|nr:hypothetical protein [Thermococcus indicus]
MGLIEDLMANRYLITPSAYYLLVDSYKKDFTLAELIKFARARGTFVIDSAIAKEFLSGKAPAPLEPPPARVPPSPRRLPKKSPPNLENLMNCRKSPLILSRILLTRLSLPNPVG